MTSSKDYASVQKALQILLAFVPQNREMGTMDISKTLGLHKSTASRLLNTLVSYDFLQQDKKTRKFRLGRAAADIGLAIKQSLKEQLISIAQPFIEDLRNNIGETISLEIWNDNSTILAHRSEAFRLRRISLVRIGDRLDIHVSAGARVILAFSGEYIVEKVLQGKFHRYTKNTMTDSETIKALLPDIRKQGYAIAKGERHLESSVIAVPIFNYENRPVASIAVITNAEGFQEKTVTDLVISLKETAKQISNKLLYVEED